MAEALHQRLHGTCVLLGEDGVLLLGASGSGKSDLALRLMDGGAQLVADDQIELWNEGGVLLARPAGGLAGLLEVRGLGIVRKPHAPQAKVRLAVQLTAREQVERLPESGSFSALGVQVRSVQLHAFDASAPAKIRLALTAEMAA